MKKRLLQVLAGTILAVAMLIGCSQVLVSGQDDLKNKSLEGTWRTAVTPRNCATGDPLGAVFPGILTFSQGGTMTGTSTAVTSVYGVWHQTHGWKEYSFATISFRYNPSGVLLGTRKITQNVVLNETGNEFTSDGEFQDFDTGENLVLSGCSTAVGMRFE